MNILNNMLNLLFVNQSDPEFGSIDADITHIMNILLRTVIQMTSSMSKDNPLSANMVAIMLGILRIMTKSHYSAFVDQYSIRDLRVFIVEILAVFYNLVKYSVFPSDWMDMIMHQNTVILGTLRQLTVVIRDKFYAPFEQEVWSTFFSCSITFLTQPSLQLDKFSVHKQSTILQRYADMRRNTALDIGAMWMQLGAHKIAFVPALVGPILEMSLIPDEELRQDTIPIFFDMMQCEYYSSVLINDSYGDTKRNNSHHKLSFESFEREMMEKLDLFVENGRGDEAYRQQFHAIMMGLCAQHNMMRVEGEAFVHLVSGLLSRLLEYRTIINKDKNKLNQMACTVSLLNFYAKINRNEMYIRYVEKLFVFHREFKNFAEAAFTLKLHSNLLKWDDTELQTMFMSNRHNGCKTHRQLKETLYREIIDLFDKDQMWESAIEMSKELIDLYENQTFDYTNLSATHTNMARLYKKILNEQRLECEYFRVVFYGKGFPSVLRNKEFVYRGQELDRLDDFSSRMLEQYPSAELLQSMDPGDEITLSNGQFILIINVLPLMDETCQTRRLREHMSENLLRYYRTNNVQRFQLSRSSVRASGLDRTIMRTGNALPGILRFAQVVESEQFNVTPLQVAIETMQQTNNELRELVKTHTRAHAMGEELSINPLSLRLKGVIDAAVMGGPVKYEEAFLTDDYLQRNPNDRLLVDELTDLIANQMPLLEVALKVHRAKMPSILSELQESLEQLFAKRQATLEAKYGERVSIAHRIWFRLAFGSFCCFLVSVFFRIRPLTCFSSQTST